MSETKVLHTAVLLITYKRLDTVKQVFQAIREAKPPRLYISSNIGKDHEETKRVMDVRKFLEEHIDWKCEVKKLYREKHLSAKYSISGAIDWFFANEEMGIILEDDCLPDQSFFWFCEELLERYKTNMKIGHISGDNFQKGIKRGDADYFFSIYNHVWGWASWADRWKTYDVELSNTNGIKFIESTIQDKKTRKYWISIFNRMKNNEIDTWDYQWTFAMWNNDQLAILPNINLIKNIGFGEDATHTTGESQFSNLKAHEITLQNHPINFVNV